MTLKTHHWIMLLIIVLVIIVVAIRFKLSASEIIQVAVVGGTFLLAIAAFENIKASEHQFRISKSPIFDVSLGEGYNGARPYEDKNGKHLYTKTVPLKIKNIGYGPAFNIYPNLRQGNFEYKFDGAVSKLIELGFSLGVKGEEVLSFTVSDMTSEASRSSLQIEVKCNNIFGKKLAHRFEGFTVFNLKSIDFA